MLTFAVSEDNNIWLRERMEELGVLEKDIDEKFVLFFRPRRSEWKTSTCVDLKHIPTGIEVKCMNEQEPIHQPFPRRRELAKIKDYQGNQLPVTRKREDTKAEGKEQKEVRSKT